LFLNKTDCIAKVERMSDLYVPGARLYYEIDGSGPLMVLIPGASGTADSFRRVSEQLKAHYSVAIYDRRGFSRSALDGPQDYGRRLETDADDVRGLIEHMGGPATVVGTSSGAIVGLEVLARHPSVVQALVPFEPPALRLLSDGSTWVKFFAEVYEVYQRDGVAAALDRFRQATFAEEDRVHMAKAPRNDANATYWFEHELRQYPPAELDLAALSTYADRMVPAAGLESRGHPCHEATMELGSKLGRDVAELPGGHIGCVSRPAEFADELVRVLGVAYPTTRAIRETG
jgi:pimeloyl-ACP methyl ester carboxylesterase